MGAEDELFLRYQRTRRPAVLAELYDLVASELFDVALHLTRSPGEAEDALQSTFAIAIERADDWDSTRRVVPWLLGILANQARAAHRSAHRQLEPERLGPPRSEDPTQQAERLELAERLDASLREVPAPFQSVLILRLKHGLSAPEIAHALRLPPGTVRSQLQRGLEILRRMLPASFAGAVVTAALGSARGLGAVRESIVAHAAALQPAGIGLATITGALVMNKLVLGGTAAVLAVLLAVVAFGPGSTTASNEAGSNGQTESIATALEDARDPALAPAPGAAERHVAESPASIDAAPVIATPTVGELLVRARRQSNDAPLGGAAVVASYKSAGWSIPEERFGLTGADGTLLFTDLPPMTVRVWLPQGGENQVVVRAGERATLELPVFDGVTVDGLVVDSEGSGIGGAEIWLSERYQPNKGHIVAHTDLRGRFELASIGPDLYIGAQAQGRALSGTQTVNGSPGDRVPLRIVLATRAATVTGRVVGPAAEPIARAVVLIGEEFPRYDVQIENGRFMPSPPPQRVLTDEVGRFEALCIPLGTRSIRARANGFASWVGEINVVAGNSEIEIALLRESRVTGCVRDASGSVVVQAHVHNGLANGLTAASTHSGGDGRFELLGLGPGRQTLIAEHAERGRAEIEVELAAGETLVRDIVLDPTPRIFGTVRDLNGRPLADVSLVAFRPFDRENRMRSSFTGPDGAYSLAVGNEYGFTVLVQERAGLRAFPLAQLEGVRASQQPFDIEVDTSALSVGRVRGVVLGPGSVPIPGIEIALWHESKGLWRTFAVDADTGAFAITRVPPGNVSFEVQSSDYPKVSIGSKLVRAGEELDLGTVVLDDAVHFTITLDGGPDESLPSLFVQLANDRDWMPMVRQDARRYRSAPLKRGKYKLRVQGDFIAPFVAEYDINGDLDERIRLEHAGMRRVTFRTPHGAGSPRYVACSVLTTDGKLAWMNGNVQAVEGIYELRVSLPFGEYRLIANVRGEWGGEAAFSMPSSGEGPPLEIVLERIPTPAK